MLLSQAVWVIQMQAKVSEQEPGAAPRGEVSPEGTTFGCFIFFQLAS